MMMHLRPYQQDAFMIRHDLENFTNEIAGDLGYEYLGVADTDMADAISGHNVVASVRFKF